MFSLAINGVQLAQVLKKSSTYHFLRTFSYHQITVGWDGDAPVPNRNINARTLIGILNDGVVGHSPPRPFWDDFLIYVSEYIRVWSKLVLNFSSSKAWYEHVGSQMFIYLNHALSGIGKSYAPNKPETLRKKKSYIPLLDTGHLRDTLRVKI